MNQKIYLGLMLMILRSHAFAQEPRIKKPHRYSCTRANIVFLVDKSVSTSIYEDFIEKALLALTHEFPLDEGSGIMMGILSFANSNITHTEITANSQQLREAAFEAAQRTQNNHDTQVQNAFVEAKHMFTNLQLQHMHRTKQRGFNDVLIVISDGQIFDLADPAAFGSDSSYLDPLGFMSYSSLRRLKEKRLTSLPSMLAKITMTFKQKKFVSSSTSPASPKTTTNPAI